ncbi:AAA family ATPase [Burkholderia ubonensis]|uniref:AAA family ATPase n=1 Tax=Burkholderia ubonensis TaxID=101571 RepID=UPI00075B8C55|nr:AAA family ATPase [Burkholderia ubonensis]KVP41640.1 ATPase [Burkholderia ubonensis]KVQ77819.1 ATPase [Burkholderia ubonensis]KVR14801.1 ATPase [Burkholderia ubonensis]KVX23442.1 ATPase [Burkholderia ubonensis]KWB37232.1 ATPase [Burkholderia ubonensis]
MSERARVGGGANDGADETARRFFVVTGGPGSGKSTLIDALERAGFARSQEAGRGVIQDQVAVDGPALPWRDRSAFAELMLGWEMRSHHLARQARGPVFFDRGVPDVIGYLRLSGLAVPAHAEAAARRFRYHRRVFIAPPWPDIYTQDAERRQDFAEAVRTCDAMVECYASYGYRLIELPRASVKARVRFVLDALDET